MPPIYFSSSLLVSEGLAGIARIWLCSILEAHISSLHIPESFVVDHVWMPPPKEEEAAKGLVGGISTIIAT